MTSDISLRSIIFRAFTVAIISISVSSCYSQEKGPKEYSKGSSISIANIDFEGIENLDLLGKVWGFLKYHHPSIAGGSLNWDYELFRFLPDYLQAKDKKKRDKLLVKWIEKLGKIEECSRCRPSKAESILKPNHDWIQIQSESLKEKLTDVYNNRHQGLQHYLGLAQGVGNPEFKNEDAYSSLNNPDDGYRLLSLFRYWNAVNYFSPYRGLTRMDWSDALKKYIPIFLDASNELEYELAVIQLVGEAGDSHANIWKGADQVNKLKGVNYPPFHVRFIEDKLVVSQYFNPELKDEAELDVGDEVTWINGKSVTELVTEKAPYYPASNHATYLRDLAEDLLRSNDNQLEVRYKTKAGQEMNKILKLYLKSELNFFRWYPDRTERSFQLLDNNIGYIHMESLAKSDIDEILEILWDTEGIVLDIRNYPQIPTLHDLVPYFVGVRVPFVKVTSVNINNPGEFNFKKTVEVPYYGNSLLSREPYQGKVVILVNEFTQSTAEFITMAYQVGSNTTVIGSQTAGADGNISIIYFPGGLKTWISGVGIYYPDSTQTQQVGIKIDKIVTPTINGIREGKDEVLEAAIKSITTN